MTKNASLEHYKLQPYDICEPCICKDNEIFLKKYCCDCQSLQPKRDCLDYKEIGRKVNGVIQNSPNHSENNTGILPSNHRW